MRAVCTFTATFEGVGLVALIGMLKSGGWPDRVLIVCALPVFAFLVCAFGYWGLIRSW